MFSSDPENPRLKKYAEVLDKLEIVDLSRERGRFARFWRGYGEAKKILGRKKFDLITAQEIEHSFLAWRLSKRFSVPWQMQIHTDIFSPYYIRHSMSNRVRAWLAKFLIPRASCLRVVSERIRKSIGRNAAVLPIYSEIASGGANIKEKYPGYDFYILMVSRLAREKNIELALDAMREIVKTFNALLVIVGDGIRRRNIEKEILFGLEANVKLEGQQESLAGYHRSSDILLITSDYEGYSMTAVEALQAGLPVVMTDVGAAGDIVKDQENGLVVPVGDKDAIIKAILRIYREAGLAEKLREGAKMTKFPYNSFEDYREKLINSFRTCKK